MKTVSQIFPRTGRISGPEVGDGAKPDVPTTDRQNEITALVRVRVLTVKSHDNLHSKKKHVVSRVCALVQDRTKR